MKEMLITQLVSILTSMLTPEMLRKAVDGILDVIEEAVKESKTKIDDTVVMPLVVAVRSAFDIPDDD